MRNVESFLKHFVLPFLLLGPNGVFDLKKNFALIELIERLHASETTEIFSPSFIERERELAVPCDENETHLVRFLFCLI